MPSSGSQHQPIPINEIPRYILLPTDFFLSFMRSGTKQHRDRRSELLQKSFSGDMSSRYQLGREVFLYAKGQKSYINRKIHFNLSKRLLYRVIRNPEMRPGRLPIQAATFYGSICYLEGNETGALHYWKFAADNDEATAMYELGRFYQKNGNRGEAFHWIQLAAGLNHSKAQLLLDKMKSAPRPDYNLNPRAAELHIEEWMVHWGFHDAEATPIGPDGGFDVKSSRAAAQVKFRGQPTPLDQINSFHGACDRRYEFEIFVSKAGFTKPALEAANKYGMALFQLDDDGTPKPINSPARRIYRE